MRLASYFLAFAVLASPALAQPAVTTDPHKGPPEDKIITVGSAFGAPESIDIYRNAASDRAARGPCAVLFAGGA